MDISSRSFLWLFAGQCDFAISLPSRARAGSRWHPKRFNDKSLESGSFSFFFWSSRNFHHSTSYRAHPRLQAISTFLSTHAISKLIRHPTCRNRKSATELVICAVKPRAAPPLPSAGWNQVVSSTRSAVQPKATMITKIIFLAKTRLSFAESVLTIQKMVGSPVWCAANGINVPDALGATDTHASWTRRRCSNVPSVWLIFAPTILRTNSVGRLAGLADSTGATIVSTSRRRMLGCVCWTTTTPPTPHVGPSLTFLLSLLVTCPRSERIK